MYILNFTTKFDLLPNQDNHKVFFSSLLANVNAAVIVRHVQEQYKYNNNRMGLSYLSNCFK